MSELETPAPDQLDLESLQAVLAVPIADSLRKFGGYTPHPDHRVRGYGERGSGYITKLLKDNHLKSCLQTRANNALVPGFKIEAVNGDEEGAEFIRYCLKNTDRPFIQSLRGIFVQAAAYGNHVAQRIWKQIESGPHRGAWTISALKPITPELVKFDHDETGKIQPDGIVIYPSPVTLGSSEMRFPRTHFMHAVWGYTYNPYGESLALECDFWVWAKDLLAKFRLVAGEKFGSPTTQAKLSRQIKKGSQEWLDLVALMTDLQNNSVAIVPPGIVIELLQANRSGDLDYDNAYDRGNKEISKAVLGSTATTEGASRGQAGGYSQAKVMGDTTDNYAWTDAIWVEGIVQRQIIEPIWYLNNGYDKPAPVFKILDDDYARMVAVSNIIMSLVQAGAQIPQRWVFEQLGIPLPLPGELLLQPAASPASPPGLDNNLFRAQHKPAVPVSARFSGSRATSIPERDKILDSIDQIALPVLSAQLKSFFESALQAVTTLPEGQPLSRVDKLPLDTQPLSAALSQALWSCFLSGKKLAAAELKDRFTPKTFAAEPELPFTAEELAAITEYYRELGVSIAGLLEEDVQVIYQKLALAQKNGWSVREFQNAVKEAALNYAGDVLSAAQGEPVSMAHAELIYRNHMMRAFSDGKDALAADPEIGDIIAGWTFVSTQDDRVRPLHQDLDGVSLPVELWNGKYSYLKPPVFHNCRCDRQIVTKFDLEMGHKWTDESKLPAYDPEHFF